MSFEPRIVHVIDSFETGGLERTVLSLAKLQVADGLKVSVIALFRNGPLASEFAQAGIQTACVGKSSALDHSALLKLRAFLKSSRANILHSHNCVSHYYMVCASLLLPQLRRFNTLHDMGEHSYTFKKELAYRSVMPLTDRVIAVCEAASRAFLDRGLVPKSKMLVIPNGIDTLKFSAVDEQSRTVAKSALGIADSDLVIGSVGRLSPVKNYRMLIQAFGNLLAAQKNLRLVLIGDGTDRESLETLANQLGVRDRVIFCGERQDVVQLMKSFDVFCLSSRTEGFSVALVEAASTGLPIVATRVGGNAEIVYETVNGMLVDEGSTEQMTHALQRLLDEESLRSNMGRLGRLAAEEKWAQQVMNQSYRTTYSI